VEIDAERREGNGLGLVHGVVVALKRGGRRLEVTE
jgi:hypothetical protein